MDDLEQKLGAILNDPQMMGKIMSMAQAMGGQKPPEAPPPPSQEGSLPHVDMETLRRISGLAQTGNIDQRERALLQALGAYLSKERIGKLEKAMRAAKIAKVASVAISARGLPSPTGR